MSVKRRRTLGRFAGKILKMLSASRRKVTLENLNKAFPELSEHERKQIATDSWVNLGITLVELLAQPKIVEDIESFIRFDNQHLVTSAFEKGRGIVFVSAHFGNWETLALGAPVCLNMPLSLIVKPQRNSRANRVLNAYRELTGNTLIDMDKAARAIVSTLANNGALALLADQSASAKADIFVPMFGRPTLTYKAPAALALRHRAALIVGFAVRDDHGYKATLEEVPFDDLENTPEGVEELTRRHVAMLEQHIRKHPDHWVWQHKRWKHQPQPEA